MRIKIIGVRMLRYRCFSFIGLMMAILPNLVFGSYHNFSESHTWRFVGGNIVSNWSFENHTTEMFEVSLGTWRTETDCHFQDPAARTGNFSMKVVFRDDTPTPDPGCNPGQPNCVFPASQVSRHMTVEPGTKYKLLYYYKVDFDEKIDGSPLVCYFDSKDAIISCETGASYYSLSSGDVDDWTEYTHILTTPALTRTLSLTMVHHVSNDDNQTQGDTYFFDDISIRKETASPTIVENRSYGDATGREYHSIQRVEDTSIVSANEFDERGRLSKQYLPIVYSGVGITVSALDLRPDMVADYSNLREAIEFLAPLSQHKTQKTQIYG